MAITRRSRLALWLILLLTVIGLAVWLAGPSTPNSSIPDQIDLGIIRRGSVTECSVRVLTSPNESAYERAFVRVASLFSGRARDWINQWHPRQRRRKTFEPLDLSKLQWRVDAPDFIQVSTVTPQQSASYYLGKPYLSLDFNVITAHTGTYRGAITAQLGSRKSVVPVEFTVVPATTTQRWLIVSTPYQENSTEQGTNFNTITRLLSALPGPVDLRLNFPASLDGYSVVLLAENALSHLNSGQIETTRAFVNRGGRLILAANAFYGSTVARANELLDGFGLTVARSEAPGITRSTNILAHALTEGVHALNFHRASPIRILDPARAHALVLDGNGDALVALAQGTNRGEIIVLSQSLWWAWAHQYEERADNARLLGNILGCPSVSPDSK